MQNLINGLAAFWFVKLVAIISAFGGAMGVVHYVWTYGIYKRLFPNLPKQVTPMPSGDGVVVLSAKHTDSPRSFDYLKSRTVKVNGIVTHSTPNGGKTPTIKLRAYPFSIGADITCEFSPEDARTVHKVDSFDLVSVIGHLEKGIEPGSQLESFRARLLLTNCAVGPPSFWLWLRRHWNDRLFFRRLGF